MVNAMMMRIHQSGHLANLKPEALALVKEGITCYKTYRTELPDAMAFWPLGLPQKEQAQYALGLEWPDHALIAVWNCASDPAVVTLPLSFAASGASQIYPAAPQNKMQIDANGTSLRVCLNGKTARLFRIEK